MNTHEIAHRASEDIRLKYNVGLRLIVRRNIDESNRIIRNF